MQKYALNDFEFRINTATWQGADLLAQSGAVKALSEVEKHFWTAAVEEAEERHEVEVIITPHRIKAYTCDCWNENRRFMCVHIAATLFKLRQYLEQRAVQRQSAAAPAAKSLSRLSIAQVLDNADPATLLEFVRLYAKQDREFALALKTWFAGGVEEAENPFALVLDPLLPKPLRPDTWKDAALRRLRKTLDNLLAQLSPAINSGNLRLQFQLSAAILEKILPLLPQTDARHLGALTAACQSAFQAQQQLQQQTGLSPELRDAVWKLWFELGRKGVFPVEMSRDVLRFVGALAMEGPERITAVQTQFREAPFPASAFWLQWVLYTQALQETPEAIGATLNAYRSRPAILREAMVQLYYLGCGPAIFEDAAQLIAEGVFSTVQQRELEDILFLIADKSGNDLYKAQYFQQKYLKTGQLDWYQQLKTLSGKKWPAARTKLITALRQAGDIRNIAVLYAAETMLEPLQGLLEVEDNPGLLQACESILLPEHRSFVLDRYIALLTAHLNSHFGRPASVFVREQLAPLVQKGGQDLVLEIIQSLVRTFTTRQTLAEELIELFPKPQQAVLLRRLQPPAGETTPSSDTPPDHLYHTTDTL